jgi:hypothetical protein
MRIKMENDSNQHRKEMKIEQNHIELKIGDKDEELVKNLQKWQEEQAKVKIEQKHIELKIGDKDEELVKNLQKWQEQQAREKIEKIRELKRINYRNKIEGKKLTIKQKYEIYHDFEPIAQKTSDDNNGTKKKSGKIWTPPKIEKQQESEFKKLGKQVKEENMGTAEILTKEMLIAEAMDAIDNMTMGPVASSVGPGVTDVKNEETQHQPTPTGGGWQHQHGIVGRGMTNHGGKVDNIEIDLEEFSLPIEIFQLGQKDRNLSYRIKMGKIIRKHRKTYLIAQMRKIQAKMQTIKRLQNISRYRKKERRNKAIKNQKRRNWRKGAHGERCKNSKAYCMNSKTNKVIFLGSKSLKQNDKIFQCKCIVLITKLNTAYNHDSKQPYLDMYSRIKRNTRRKRQW